MKYLAVLVALAVTPAYAAENVTFKNCKAAFAAGYHDMKRGEPGYSGKLDRNHDGVACETDNRWVEQRKDGKFHKVDEPEEDEK
jgi:hypothetical protein